MVSPSIAVVTVPDTAVLFLIMVVPALTVTGAATPVPKSLTAIVLLVINDCGSTPVASVNESPVA
ncbi:MAG: hypothetical protein V1736_06010, partial [Pseudomonadota bacterium]